MPQWAYIVIFLVVLGLCVAYLAWAVAQFLNAWERRKKARARRAQLERWETGMLELLCTPGPPEHRLGPLRRLHGIIDNNLRELGGSAPSLRKSLENALVIRTTEPQVIRERLGRTRSCS